MERYAESAYTSRLVFSAKSPSDTRLSCTWAAVTRQLQINLCCTSTTMWFLEPKWFCPRFFVQRASPSFLPPFRLAPCRGCGSRPDGFIFFPTVALSGRRHNARIHNLSLRRLIPQFLQLPVESLVQGVEDAGLGQGLLEAPNGGGSPARTAVLKGRRSGGPGDLSTTLVRRLRRKGCTGTGESGS